MQTVGVICEYNPLHNGHKKQLDVIRARFGPDCAIVCIMSGNYVQRGEPAIFPKDIRAAAAIHCGADLVLELPVTLALSSAEGFAAGGVGILSGFCDYLCFGAETPDSDMLMQTAQALLSEEFPPLLKRSLSTGCSFPAARQAALEQMGISPEILTSPNNILSIEYCKAILASGSTMAPFPIPRPGSYHAETPDADNPSATSLRQLILRRQDWLSYVPDAARPVLSGGTVHSLSFGEHAVLARLRTMADSEFESLPYGSEGLWRRLMHACRSQSSLDGILEAVKSKRYTYTRLCRMIMCAYLGIDQQMMELLPPYVRILAFNQRGRSVLREARSHIALVNAGEAVDSPYWALERRCSDLYGLFRCGLPDSPGQEEKLRVFYRSSDPREEFP